MAVGLPATASGKTPQAGKSRVVLIRNEHVVLGLRKNDADLLQQMLDEAMMSLFGLDSPSACWAHIIKPDDIVGIKTNVWRYLPTPPELEQAFRRGVLGAGVSTRCSATSLSGAVDLRVSRGRPSVSAALPGTARTTLARSSR